MAFPDSSAESPYREAYSGIVVQRGDGDTGVPPGVDRWRALLGQSRHSSGHDLPERWTEMAYFDVLSERRKRIAGVIRHGFARLGE
jgi:hypothetical protein